MKKLFALLLLLNGLAFSAQAQLPADPWKSTPVQPKPAVAEAPQTYDNNLPFNPWQQASSTDAAKPAKKEIPKINGLSINPIAALGEKQ